MSMTKEIHKITINQQWWNDIVEFKFIRNVPKNQKIEIKNVLESERKKNSLIMWELIQSDSFNLTSNQIYSLLARIKNININIFSLFICFFFSHFYFLIFSDHFIKFFLLFWHLITHFLFFFCWSHQIWLFLFYSSLFQ